SKRDWSSDVCSSDLQPIGTRFPKWHSHTAGIHNSNLPNRSVKLHVGMTANDQPNVESFKDRHETIFRSKTGKYVSVVSRCGVAKQHLANPGNLQAKGQRPARQQALVFGKKLLRIPAHNLSKSLRNGACLLPCPRGKHLAVAIA